MMPAADDAEGVVSFFEMDDFSVCHPEHPTADLLSGISRFARTKDLQIRDLYGTV